jgi:hypothetical protein
MTKLDMQTVAPRTQREGRDRAEERAMASIDGRRRRRLGKTKQIIFRVTPERREQIIRLSNALACSFTETMERAIQELDDKMKGTRL